MFKDLTSGFKKFFTGQRVLVFIALLILAYAIYSYIGEKSFTLDKMETGTGSIPVQSGGNAPVQQPSELYAQSQNVIQSGANSPYTPLKTVSNPSDLLPQDQNSKWGTLNPTLNPNDVIIPDLLEAGYHIGLDTIGQTLRNANQQERSDPIIPKQNAWGIYMSTIEPDLGRTPLELGQGCK